VSDVPVDQHRDQFGDSEYRQLLAVYQLRRRMERVAVADDAAQQPANVVTRALAVRELLELIAALDRRVPQVQRAGEASIAREAAALKARALRRIEELEREPAS
jgi:hypothetical protein